jgi:hypothetical protein
MTRLHVEHVFDGATDGLLEIRVGLELFPLNNAPGQVARRHGRPRRRDVNADGRRPGSTQAQERRASSTR